MTRNDIVDNLGTIAKSGSQAFSKEVRDKDPQAAESIIGQFGVGFYSSFIVAEHVEVLSKSEGQQGVRWVSDGSVRLIYGFNFCLNRASMKYQMQ